MSHDDLVAAFLARGGKIQKVESGARSMTDRQMYEAIGYEPSRLVKYEVLMMGEDYSEWMEEISAQSAKRAMEKAGEMFPEARVLSCEPLGSRGDRLYRQAMRDSD